jgi:hypothetical protein
VSAQRRASYSASEQSTGALPGGSLRSRVYWRSWVRTWSGLALNAVTEEAGPRSRAEVGASSATCASYAVEGAWEVAAGGPAGRPRDRGKSRASGSGRLLEPGRGDGGTPRRSSSEPRVDCRPRVDMTSTRKSAVGSLELVGPGNDSHVNGLAPKLRSDSAVAAEVGHTKKSSGVIPKIPAQLPHLW